MRDLVRFRALAGRILRKVLLTVLGWLLIFVVGVYLSGLLDVVTACAAFHLLCGSAWMQAMVALVDQADSRPADRRGA